MPAETDADVAALIARLRAGDHSALAELLADASGRRIFLMQDDEDRQRHNDNLLRNLRAPFKN